jgi:hypothetical protein
VNLAPGLLEGHICKGRLILYQNICLIVCGTNLHRRKYMQSLKKNWDPWRVMLPYFHARLTFVFLDSLTMSIFFKFYFVCIMTVEGTKYRCVFDENDILANFMIFKTTIYCTCNWVTMFACISKEKKMIFANFCEWYGFAYIKTSYLIKHPFILLT